MGFPSRVNVVQAPAVAGDPASTNPRFTVDAGPGSLVAGPAGVTVGYFAWATSNGLADPSTGETDFYNIVSNSGVSTPTGFVGRRQGDALITQFLADSTMVIPQGLEVTLYSGGDFWTVNNGATSTAPNQKAYANYATGAVTFAATGTPPTGASVTASVAVNSSTSYTITTNTAVSCSIAGTTMTVGAVTGVVAPGQVVTGTGVNVTTTIVAQLTGSPGATGTYQVSVSQTVPSFTATFSGGCFTPAATITGYFAPGQTLSGTGITSTNTILAQISGTTGGAGVYYVSIGQAASVGTATATQGTLTVTAIGSGALAVGDLLSGGVSANTYITAYVGVIGGYQTYLVNNSQTVSSQTITVYSGIETKWYCMSAAAPGELCKISAQPLG